MRTSVRLQGMNSIASSRVSRSGGAAARAQDLALVRRALSGDSRSRLQVARRLDRIPVNVRACNRRLGWPLSFEEEQDVVQDVALALWGKLDSFAGRSTLDTWIYGFGVKQVARAAERKYRAQRVESAELDQLPGPCEDSPASVDGQVLARAVGRLGPEVRLILWLRIYQQLPFERIAARLSSNSNTVKTRYQRGLSRLRRRLGPARAAS